MTQAICFHCGSKKFGAFTPCPGCETSPQDEEQLAISLLLTDHFMSAAELADTAQQIRKTGKPPALAPEIRQELLETIQVGTAWFREKTGRGPLQERSPSNPVPAKHPDEIQSGHHRFPHLCARCGTETVAGLWPLPVLAKPQIHAASLLTVAVGTLVLEETEKTVAVPVCATCHAWLLKQKKVDTWFSRLATIGVTSGILGGIALSIWRVPIEHLNGWVMALFMAGCAVVGVGIAYLATGLLFRMLPLWKGVTFCQWDGEELYFENATFRERYQAILAR